MRDDETCLSLRVSLSPNRAPKARMLAKRVARLLNAEDGARGFLAMLRKGWQGRRGADERES